MDDTRWRRDENWFGTEIEDSFVMVNVDSGKYISLNSTANVIWSALSDARTANEIAGHMRTLYEVSEDQCRAAVDRILAEMRRLKMAEPI